MFFFLCISSSSISLRSGITTSFVLYIFPTVILITFSQPQVLNYSFESYEISILVGKKWLNIGNFIWHYSYLLTPLMLGVEIHLIGHYYMLIHICICIIKNIINIISFLWPPCPYRNCHWSLYLTTKELQFTVLN